MKSQIVGSLLIGTLGVGAATLLWTQVPNSSASEDGAAESWLCARTAELAGELRSDWVNQGRTDASASAAVEAAVADLDKGIAWAERGCASDGTGGIHVPGMLESLLKGGRTSVEAP
jgi:hypothetical protein